MGRPAVDLNGKKFGRLKVVSRGKKQVKNGKVYWLCECDCGNSLEVRGDKLRTGRTVSCKCKKSDDPGGTTHGMTGTRVHRVWTSMRQRCLNTNHESYKNYGGRGIAICPSWDTFEQFYKDMGDPPVKFDIDRKNNNGPYSKKNCRWVTRKVNTNNRRSNIVLEHKGKTHSASEWAEIKDIPYLVLLKRVHDGWTPERALTTPTKLGFKPRVRS